MEVQQPADVVLAHVNIRLKEGDYDRVNELLSSGLEVSRQDKRLWDKYFEFLYRTQRKDDLATFADRYLNHLIQTAQTNRLVTDYKRTIQIIPSYQPAHPEIRFQLANACRMNGDAMSAIKLVNGLHKLFPNYEKLVPAYQLMKQSLEDLPNMSAQAAKCAQLIKVLQNKFPEQEKESVTTTKAVYDLEALAVKTEVEKSLEDPAKIKEPTGDGGSKDLSPIEFKL